MECKKHNVKADFRKTKYVKYSKQIKCAGWFDPENRELVVAINHEDWLEVLVHEYAHFTQWAESAPAWIDNINGIGNIDEWLSGLDISEIDKYIAQARSLELDNEKRSVKLIMEWGLDDIIDVDQYTQKANAYVLYYNWLHKTRKWSKPGNSPYKNKNILSKMSTKFDMNYETIDPEIESLFMLENI